MLKKLNLICFILIILTVISIASNYKEKQNLSQETLDKNFESKLSKSHIITKKSNNRIEIKMEDLDKMAPFLQKNSSILSLENSKKEIEEKEFIWEENFQTNIKSKADEIIDSLFSNLTDNEEDIALKTCLKYCFPQFYMKGLLSKEQEKKFLEINGIMVADFEILHGTTPIKDKESEQKVNKKIREINEQYFIDCINILTPEQQLEFAKIVNEKFIPQLREDVKNHGIECLRAPWF